MTKLNWSKQYKNTPNGTRLAMSSSSTPVARRGTPVSYRGGRVQAGVNLTSKERVLIVDGAREQQILPWIVARAAFRTLAERGVLVLDGAGRPASDDLDMARFQRVTGSVNLHGGWATGIYGATPYLSYHEYMGDARILVPLRPLIKAARRMPAPEGRGA